MTMQTNKLTLSQETLRNLAQGEPGQPKNEMIMTTQPHCPGCSAPTHRPPV